MSEVTRKKLDRAEHQLFQAFARLKDGEDIGTYEITDPLEKYVEAKVLHMLDDFHVLKVADYD